MVGGADGSVSLVWMEAMHMPTGSPVAAHLVRTETPPPRMADLTLAAIFSVPETVSLVANPREALRTSSEQEKFFLMAFSFPN